MSMPEQLIFIRHSQSQPQPALPPSRWPLTETGRRRCAGLAERLRPYALGIIICSDEQKTLETGALAAGRLGLPHGAAPGLHEHRREQVGWLAQGEFERAVLGAFARPGELLFGEETFEQARDRFGRAVSAVRAAHAGRRVAIVTHGTVLALFVAQHAGIAPEPFWRRLGMPAIVVLGLPDFGLVDLVERID